AHAGEDDPHVGKLLLDQLQRVVERRQHHDGGAVLVVVKHRDVEVALETLLDLEAAGRRDVLEIDAAEDGRDRLHGAHDLVHVLVASASGNASTPAKDL